MATLVRKTPASPRTSASARKPVTRAKPAPAKTAAAPAKAVPAPAKKTAVSAKKAPAPLMPAVTQAVPTAAGKPKADKSKKPKLVRDSFTIPKAEYMAIDALKQRAGKLGQSPKKSELLRAGIMQLAALNDAAFLAALSKVPAIKTGRPKA